MVQGECSGGTIGWPYAESRGAPQSGFARYYIDTETSENLTDVPFTVGKGSAGVYLDGKIYVLQGDVNGRNNGSTPLPELVAEGIRYPGAGFACFSLTSGIGPGDVDGNGVVNGLDLTAVITAWETEPGDLLWNEDADLDDNNIVNGLDLTEVISNWTVASAAAPEASLDSKPGRGNGRGKGNVKQK
jgi:hypothetical protein